MATSKQRIQAYIVQQLFESFEAERVEWNLSQSQALERILAERYQAEKRSLLAPAASDRLKWLEDKLIDRTWLNNRSFDEIFNRLGTLEDIVSQLSRKLDCELPISDLSGESNSELLVSDLSGESNSELLVSDLSGESNSELLVSDLSGESNSELLVSDLSGESNSELLVSDLSGESNSELLEETNGSLPTGELEETNGSLPTGELKETNGSLPASELEETNGSLPLTINSTHPYFDRLILCLERDEHLSFWTDDNSFSPDIREAKLYEKETYLLKQREKLVEHYSRDWLKFAPAKICIKKDGDRYSLQEILSRWEKLEERKAKRKSARKKGAIAT